MAKPLWQHFLTILMLGVAAHRGLVGYTLFLADGIAPATIVVTYGAQVLAALATAIGIFFARGWAVVPLVALGVAIGSTALYEAFVIGAHSGAAAVSQLGVVAVSTGLLFFVLRHELRRSRGSDSRE